MSARSGLSQPKQRRSGASMLEFTLVAIPVIFLLIGIFELARGMWIYNSVAHGVKEAARFAIVHGNNCSYSPNSCTVTISQICGVLQYHAAGLPAGQVVNVTLQRETSTRTFTNLGLCLAATNLVTDIFPSQVPGGTLNSGGDQGRWIEIRAAYRFNSALAFYWTGQRGFTFGRFDLGAVSRERIQY